MDATATRRYLHDECAVFRRTKEEFGGLSNMAAGFPIRIFQTDIRTSEALYQALRFPDRPDIQTAIIEQKSPMTAKMVSRRELKFSRTDWAEKRVAIMRWCLRVKLVQNFQKFSRLLERTGDLPIVEHSRRDAFWGAKWEDETGYFVGENVLGRLLMELRQELNDGAWPRSSISPPKIRHAILLGAAVHTVFAVSEKARRGQLRIRELD